MKRLLKAVVVVLTLAMVLGVAGMATGCSSGSGGGYYNDAYSSQAVTSYAPDAIDGGYDMAVGEMSSQAGSGSTLLDGQERKVTKTANLSLQTKEFDSVLAQLDNAIAMNDGYKSDSQLSGRDISYENSRARYGTLTVKVPSQNYSAFMAAVEDLANVTSKNESEEDITTQYYDTATWLDSLLIWEERLLSMLGYAETLEEMLEIEQELMGVRQQIQYYNQMMNVYSGMVDYSTVYIHVQELLDVEVVPQGLFQDIGDTFGDSFNMFLRFVEGLVTVLIYLLPYLVIAGVIVVLVVVLTRKAAKRRALNPPAAQPSAAHTQQGYPQPDAAQYPQQPQAYPSDPQDNPPADPQA